MNAIFADWAYVELLGDDAIHALAGRILFRRLPDSRKTIIIVVKERRESTV